MSRKRIEKIMILSAKVDGNISNKKNMVSSFPPTSPISESQGRIIEDVAKLLDHDVMLSSSDSETNLLDGGKNHFQSMLPLTCYDALIIGTKNKITPQKDPFIFDGDDPVYLPPFNMSWSSPDSDSNINENIPSNSQQCQLEKNGEIKMSSVPSTPSSVSTSKGARIYDRKNSCPYCTKLITNFTRHITTQHPLEAEVIEYNKILDPDLRERKRKREIVSKQIRNRGNYLYNQDVMNKPGGILLPNRRPKLAAEATDYAICIQCCGTFKRTLLYRHLKKCPNRKQSPEGKSRKRVLKSSSILLSPDNAEITESLRTHIFPIFKSDNIAKIAMTEPLICSYGSLLLSNHKEHHLKTHITSKMRDLAKLFMVIQEQNPSITTFELAFDPSHFNVLMNAVKINSGYDELTGFVKVPSMPQRLCGAIKDCADILMRRTIQNSMLTPSSKKIIKNKLADFKIIFQHAWKFEISTNAEKSRKKQKMLKSDVMPSTTDIKKICTAVMKIEVNIAQQFEKKKSYAIYEELCKITIAHIIIFNRRRAGEVARAPLENYLAGRHEKQDIPKEILDTMNSEEQDAINALYCFHIPGKRGRTVPILLRNQMKKNVDTIFTYRNLVGISNDNKYLFPKLGGEPYFCGTKILRDLRCKFSLTNPDHLTSTGLRHHVATMSQVAGKNNSYVNALSHFLGHTPGTHKGNYIIPQLALEKGKVGLNLLQLAEGKIGSLTQSGTNDACQNEIDSSVPQSLTTIKSNLLSKEATSVEENVSHNLDTSSERVVISGSERSSLSDSLDGKTIREKRKGNIIRKRWLEQEKADLYKHFANYFIQGRDPGAAKINEIKTKTGILSMRSWKQINTFINNHRVKNLPLPPDLQKKRKAYLL